MDLEWTWNGPGLDLDLSLTIFFQKILRYL